MDSTGLKLEGTTGEDWKADRSPGKVARWLWPRFVEIWIFAAIATFFIIRVLGSNAFHKLLPAINLRHLP